MKLVKACIATAAFAVMLVVPSMASASPVLTHPTGTPAGNIKILATNVAHANTVLATRLTTSAGTIECATATITGEVLTNSGTHILGTITTAEFKGKVTETGHENVAQCKAPGIFGTVTVTPNHTINPTHTPTGGSPHPSLPWCITASNLNDQFEVFGDKNNCAEKRPLTFTFHSSLVGACSYQKAEVIGTYTTHPSSDAILTINKQVFTRITGSGFCPASGELDMAFTLTTDEKEVSGTPLYIS